MHKIRFTVDLPDDCSFKELREYIDRVSEVLLAPSTLSTDDHLRRFGSRVSKCEVHEVFRTISSSEPLLDKPITINEHAHGDDYHEHDRSSHVDPPAGCVHVDTKPTDTKPTDTKPTDTKPTDTCYDG